MSEKRGPFDELIEDLKLYIQEHESPGQATNEELGSAVRVLEAAGRVDKELRAGLKWLYIVRDRMQFTGRDIERLEAFCESLHTLLESLPDEKEKKFGGGNEH